MKDNEYSTAHEYDQERGEMAEMERLERDYQEVRQGHAELMAQNKILRSQIGELANLNDDLHLINEDLVAALEAVNEWFPIATQVHKFTAIPECFEKVRAALAKAENK